METTDAFLNAILDSLVDPILVADTSHVIRYMNRAARAFYEGGETLLGKSLLECHNSASCEKISRALATLRGGAEEVLISEDGQKRVYMRAVRDVDGRLIGYYERYERRGREQCLEDSG